MSEKHQWVKPHLGPVYCSHCDRLQLSAGEVCAGSLESQLTTALDQLEKAKKALRTIAHSSNHDKYSNIEGCCYSTCLACLAASTLKELEK
jgi:hypothetical protein